MTDDPDTTDIEFTAEDDTYEPMPLALSDGDTLIFDPTEFAEVTNSLAVMQVGDNLMLLDRETLKWVNVKNLRQPASPVSVIANRK